VAPRVQVKNDPKALEETFKAADEDGSGLISYNEFKNIFIKVVDVVEELRKR
jgi:Ca2+-binding EF-hand superfamily protein